MGISIPTAALLMSAAHQIRRVSRWHCALYKFTYLLTFAAVVDFIFFSAPNLRRRSADRQQVLTRSVVTLIYRNWVRNLGPLSTKNWRPKASKFGPNFGQLGNLIAYISGTKQDIAKRKTALQTAVSLACECLNWWTLVYKRRKIWPYFRVIQRVRSICII